MSDSTTPEFKLPDGITPEILSEAFVIMAEKVKAQIPPSPEPVSRQSRPSGRRLVISRQVITVVVVLFGIASCCNCYLSIPFGWMLSIFGIVAGFCLPLMLLLEFLKCAGTQIHSQFKQGETYYREFAFQPSVRTFGILAALLVAGTLGLVLGYASIYTSISRSIPHSINVDTDGFGAIYFSIVTFATVGYGDIYPVSVLARIVVVSEILLAWGLLAVVVSSLISWVTSNVQRQHDKMLADEERQMQSTEAAIKTAGVGHYSGEKGLDKFFEEAKKRLAKKAKTK